MDYRAIIVLSAIGLALVVAGVLVYFDIKRRRPQFTIALWPDKNDPVSISVGLSYRYGAKRNTKAISVLLDDLLAFGIERNNARSNWLDGLHVIVYPVTHVLPHRPGHVSAGIYGRERWLPFVTRRAFHIHDDAAGFGALEHEGVQHHLPWALGLGDNRKHDPKWIAAQDEFSRFRAERRKES